MEVAYVVIALVILVGAYLVFASKKKAPPPKLSDRGAQAPQARREAKQERAPAPAAPTSAEKQAAPSQAAEAEAEIPIETVPGALPPEPDALQHLRAGLSRSRGEEGFFGRLRAIFAGKREIDPAIVEEMEQVLLSSDVGVDTTRELLSSVREGLDRGDLSNPDKVWQELSDKARQLLSVGRVGPIEIATRPTVVLLVGVNGAGKTTSIGKLATKFQAAGFRSVLAAGDTFRAAAVQQLVVWGERVDCEVVRGKDGADPGSVVFDAIKAAQASGADLVLADTAGRLHTKSNLMSEMKKIAKTADKALAGAPHEILLVIDATNGQNALAQAREFRDALPLTGIVLTKLDGTAKGGVVLGIASELGLPVRFIGLGERPDDLHEFRPEDFVEALLGHEADS